jgi:hypothetical protein
MFDASSKGYSFAHGIRGILSMMAAQREETMAKKGKGLKKPKKLAKKLKEEAKKQTKKSNAEVDRSEVKPPSPFSS